jgi:TadE-like protein
LKNRGFFEAAQEFEAREGRKAVHGSIVAGAMATRNRWLVRFLLQEDQDAREPRMQARKVELGEDGQAMAEFALTFPVVLTMVTLIMQFALTFNGTALVRYAAYNAVRSAAVYLPLNGGNGNNSTVLQKARLAVAMTMAPVCPRGFAGGFGAPPVGGNLGLIDLTDRLAYAYGVLVMTPNSVTLRTRSGASSGWNVRDTIVCQVKFYFPMIVPPANQFIWLLRGGSGDPIAQLVSGKTNGLVKALPMTGKAAFIYTGQDRPTR